ncbi:hypothetical protein AB8P51_00010 [Muriicola sp. SD30]|uniref:hypothetical protein n=1 Tax=Muriicola sp. SD30 TaxID=3240936 RepID=UPI00350F7DDE
MKFIVTIFLFSQIVFAQDVESPRVLVLTPIEFNLDTSLNLVSKEYQTTLTDEQVVECISSKNEYDDRDFVKKMNEMECEFARNSDISTSFTYYLYGWLTFKLYGIFDDAIIYPAKGPDKRNLDLYESLSQKHAVNWIVDLKEVEFIKEPDGLQGTAKVVLWNKNTNQITLSTEIEIDDQNYGGEMRCDDGEISCLMINGAVYISHEILKSMYSEEKYWR